MDEQKNDPKEKLKVIVSTEHQERRVTVKGFVKNEGDDIVCLQELKALYKNFDGFVITIDSVKFESELSGNETISFQFPERDKPVNFCICEVVVSKFKVK